MWSDETSKNTMWHIWRKNGSAYEPKNTIHTVKLTSGSIMVSGCFSSHGTVGIQIIKGKVNGAMYWENLENKLVAMVEWSSISYGQRRGAAFNQQVLPDEFAMEIFSISHIGYP